MTLTPENGMHEHGRNARRSIPEKTLLMRNAPRNPNPKLGFNPVSCYVSFPAGVMNKNRRQQRTTTVFSAGIQHYGDQQ